MDEQKTLVLVMPERKTFPNAGCLEMAAASERLKQCLGTRLKRGEALKVLRVLEGEVDEIFPQPGIDDDLSEWARIIFPDSEATYGHSCLLVPLSDLKEIDAGFYSAKIRQFTYKVEGQFFVILEYIGPSPEERLELPFSFISDEDIAVLDG